MYYNDPFSIPDDLKNHVNQVNILVGENGSGKSSLLRELGQMYLDQGIRKVIGIANTIHDKFNIRHENFECLKASYGKAIVRRTLKAALQIMINSKVDRFYEIAETLRYVHFDSMIGFKITGLKPDFSNVIKYAEIDETQGNLIISLLQTYQRDNWRNGGIQQIDLYRGSFDALKGAESLELLKFEALLKKLRIIRDVEIFLKKDRKFIPAHQGSSGELTIITTFIYLMATLRTGARILIDEPENSLHPKWQIEYVKTLYDLVYRYEPTTFIATHSPLIVTSAEIELGYRVSVFKGNGQTFQLMDGAANNVEEIYQDFFDVTTPENRFLSQFLVKKMNQLSANEISIDSFETLISDLRENAFDPRQKDVLNGIREMGRDIIAKNN